MSESHRFKLQYEQNRLCLLDTKQLFEPFFVDFSSKKNRYRIARAHPKTEQLGRAVGVSTSYQPTVIDLTAGFGQDAFILASLGCSVQLVEQNTTIAKLLQDGLNRAQANKNLQPFIKNIKSLEIKNSMVFLNQLYSTEYPDVIYLDPMFPAHTKQSLVKKPAQILQLLVEETCHEVLLLKLALTKTRKSVVVKRAKRTPSIHIPQAPTFSLIGKTCRFDIYTTIQKKL